VRADIARAIRELRQGRRWTQRELAARLGLSQSRLSELEGGQGSFSAEHLLAIAQLFNVGLSHFGGTKNDPADHLQNALVRFGAEHLLASDKVIVAEHLDDLSIVIRDTLILANPRQVTALAPAIVRNIDVIDLNRLSVRFAEVGFESRLYWLVENVLIALQSELSHPLSREWTARYRRAMTVLEAFLTDILTRRASETRAPDILDTIVRSAKTVDELRASASAPSRRWNIITSLQPYDFAFALAQVRPDA
jgi:transcriptional regulator with XRE-family HTH domain